MTLLVHLVIFLLYVEFAEKVECNDRVDVDHNDQQHDSQNKLFISGKLLAIVSHYNSFVYLFAVVGY